LVLICFLSVLASGCGGGGSTSVIIAPEAAFLATPTSGVYDLVVTFSENNVGEIESRLWDFGDGNTSTDQDPTHTYTSPGIFAVSLTVTGPGGTSTFTCDPCVEVLELPPTAGFDVTPTSGTYDLLVSFTDASTGVITSKLWDFGDGTTSEEENPNHLYTEAGTYSVSLMVTGPGGGDTMVCDSCITVLDPPPVANFLVTPTSGAGPLEVAFTGQSTGVISSRQWDFGDPGSGTENNSDQVSPFHIYQQPGTYQVTLVVTGPGGEDTSICSSCVVVTDEESPEILDMPMDMLLGTDPGECQAVASWIEPTATDNYGLSTLVSDHLSGDAFPVGETIVTYIATDLAGNETSSSFSVSVEDQEPPQLIGMPSDIDLDSSPGLCSAAHVWDAPTAIDNCGVATLTSDHQSGDTFALGTTTVSYSTTDIHGNTISGSFTVSVHDLESPSISGLPAEMSLQSEPGSCSAMASWTTPLITDNCGVASSGADFASGDTFGIGTTTVTYTATDNSGNSSTSAFMITVEDTEDPMISGMPVDLTVENDPGSCGAMVTWSEPLVEDNCPGSEISSDQMSGSIFDQGTSTVTYTAMDQAGNTSTSSFTVSVLDSESPVISGMPIDMNVENDLGSCGAVVNWMDPTASDNCGVPGLTSDFISGTMFPIGDTVVSFLATDDSGNTTTASFTITVTDTENPTLMAIPMDIEISTDPGLCSAIATWSAPVTVDNCGIASLVADHSSGESFPRGMTSVTYTANDDNGNTVSVSFTITVTDDEAPIISGMPTDMTVESSSGSCSGTTSWIDPLVSENCGSATLEVDQRPGSRFPIGSTTVSYTAIDSSGNSSTSSFTVTVLDTESPTIIGLPMDLILDNDQGSCDAVATWAEPTASDNCAVLSMTSDHVSGSAFPQGKTLVSYLATDESGNTTSSSFSITILDSESPTISGLSGDLIIENDLGICGAVVSWTEPVSSDNCSVLSLAGDHLSGSTFALGDTVVSYLATDESGNTTSRSFSITILDTESPTISGLSGDLIIENDPGTCAAVVSWTDPVSSDNCSVLSLAGDHLSGSTFALGDTVVSYLATDESGNTTSRSFSITILDTESPTVSAVPADMQLSTSAGTCSANASWIEPVATDNCGIQGWVSNHTSGDSFALGLTTVTYVASDATSNSTSVSFTITVIDDEDPIIVAMPGNLTLENISGACSAPAAWTEPTASDNCGSVTLSSDHLVGSEFSVGSTVVRYTALDENGNSSSSSFTVTVLDIEGPSISGISSDLLVSTDPGDCGAVVNWSQPTASDNCGLLSFSGSHLSGSTFPQGETMVSYTAIDESGTSSSLSFSVTVSDDENPIILGAPVSINITTEPGVCSSVALWNEPMATDNCGPTSLTSDSPSGSQFQLGASTVTYTATDNFGNMTTSTFLVTVSDAEAPQISGIPANITITAELGQASAVVTWIDPLVDDNCGSTTLASNYLSGDSFPIGTTEVLFTAIDNSGNESSEFFSVVVNAMAPLADFIATNVSGTYPLTVDFVDTSTGLITDWLWDFGDGTTSAIQSPTHLYTQEGSYTVNLIVSGPGGSGSMSCQPCVQVAIPPDYLFKIGDQSMAQGIPGSFSILLDNNGGDVQAWSYGVCHDKGMLTCLEVADGAILATVNNGTPPDFSIVQIHPSGFTAGVVVSFTSSFSLLPGFNYEINVATYQGDVAGVTSIDFCDTIGTPSISTVVVVDGQTLIPECSAATVEIQNSN